MLLKLECLCNFWFEKERKKKKKKRGGGGGGGGRYRAVRSSGAVSHAVQGCRGFEWQKSVLAIWMMVITGPFDLFCWNQPQMVMMQAWLTVWDADTETLRSPCWEPRPIKGPFYEPGLFQNFIILCALITICQELCFFFSISAMSVHSLSFLPVLFRPGKWLLVVLVLCFSTHFDAPSWLTESACSVQCTIPWLPLKCRLKWIKRLIWALVICIETPHAV